MGNKFHENNILLELDEIKVMEILLCIKHKNYPAPYLILSQIIIKNEQENTSEKMMTFNKILVLKIT